MLEYEHGIKVKSQIRKSALRVAGIYAVVSCVWLAFSDSAAMVLAMDFAYFAWFQTAKGLFFVSATSVILYVFSKRQFERLTDAQDTREREMLASLHEKEALLREINHRVKNNLQVIISMLNLQGGDDVRFADLAQKVRSMALAQDLLTSSPDLSSINARDFATRLAESLNAGIAQPCVKITGKGDSITLSSDVAVSIGILIAEACSNAARYSHRTGADPASILISIKDDAGSTIVEVRDDGTGFPDRQDGAKASQCTGIGFALMEAIAEQVHGTLIRRNDGGAVVELRIAAAGQPNTSQPTTG